MKLNKSILIALIMLFAAGLAVDASARVVHIKRKPPVKKMVIVKPKTPYKNGVWISGNWNWNGHEYVWADGHWVKPRIGFRWIDGHWKQQADGWIWIKGHWIKL